MSTEYTHVLSAGEQYFCRNVINRPIRTVKHGPAQVDNFVATDIENFPEVI